MAHPTSRSFRYVGIPVVAAGIALLAFAAGPEASAPTPFDAPAATPTAPGPTPGASATDARERAPARRLGCWEAPIGTELQFHLVDRLTVALRSQAGGSQPGGALHVEGDVLTTVLDRRADEVLVRHQLNGLHCLDANGRPLTGDARADALCAAAANPVLVRMRSDGAVVGFGFADGLDGDQRNFLRATVGLCAFPSPRDAQSTNWSIDGDDTTGSFHARCTAERDGETLTVLRVRERYTSIVGQQELPAHTTSGEARATFAAELGWLTSVHVDEGFALTLPMADLQALTTRQASLVLVRTAHAAVLDDTAALWARASAPATSRGEVLGARAVEDERAQWRQRLHGVGIESLLAELVALFARQPVDPEALDAAFQKLQWAIALDDHNASAVEQAVLEGRVRDDAMRAAVGAFGAAATARAQRALASLCFQEGRADDVRDAAALSMLQVEKPTAVLVDGMFAVASTDSPRRDGALLIAGALAGRASEPLADGRSPLQALLAMEDDAQARGTVADWLLAVGNTRAPAALPIALRRLDDADPAVRAASCVVLRDQTDATAVRALLERGLADRDSRVRLEAVLALASHRDPEVRAALQQVAELDTDANVRNRAARALQAS